MPRHHAGGGAGQVDHAAYDFIDFGDAAHGRHGFDTGHQTGLGGQRLDEVGAHPCGGDGVDAYAFARPLDGQRAGQVDYRAFARLVRNIGVEPAA